MTEIFTLQLILKGRTQSFLVGNFVTCNFSYFYLRSMTFFFISLGLVCSHFAKVVPSATSKIKWCRSFATKFTRTKPLKKFNKSYQIKVSKVCR